MIRSTLGCMIDHLVYATPDLEATIGTFADAFGVEPTAGGQHVGKGTRNALIGLHIGPRSADGSERSCYLEIVGPDLDQPNPDGPRPFGIDTLNQPALVAWCARPIDLDNARSTLLRQGYDPGPIDAMTRRRTDGVLLQWRLTYPQLSAQFGATIPFMIDWLASEHPTASLPTVLRLEQLELGCAAPERLATILTGIDLPINDDPVFRLSRSADPFIAATIWRGDGSTRILT